MKDRWEVDGEHYLNYHNRHLRDLQEEKKKRIWSAIIRRHFLLRQKAGNLNAIINYITIIE